MLKSCLIMLAVNLIFFFFFNKVAYEQLVVVLFICGVVYIYIRGVQSSRYLYLYLFREEKYLYLYSSKIQNRHTNL